MEITGKVFSGMGVGQEYLELEPYQQKIEDITGFRPFPGTLNLRAEEEKVSQVLERAENFRVEGFKHGGEKYSGIDVYPAELDGISVAVLRMDVTDYGPEVIEVVADEKLREELDLEDGDKVELSFQR